MAIKHSVIKQSNEKGYASEWNKEHIIDSDVNFNFFSGINLREPINPSDIATKYYVDGVKSTILTYIDNKETSILNNIEGVRLNLITYIDNKETSILDHVATVESTILTYVDDTKATIIDYVDRKIPPPGPSINASNIKFVDVIPGGFQVGPRGGGSVGFDHGGRGDPPKFVFTQMYIHNGTNLDIVDSFIISIDNFRVNIGLQSWSDRTIIVTLFVQCVW